MVTARSSAANSGVAYPYTSAQVIYIVRTAWLTGIALVVAGIALLGSSKLVKLASSLT